MIDHWDHERRNWLRSIGYGRGRVNIKRWIFLAILIALFAAPAFGRFL